MHKLCIMKRILINLKSFFSKIILRKLHAVALCCIAGPILLTGLTEAGTGSTETAGSFPEPAVEADPLALNYHLMHPGGKSAPGDPNAAFYLDGTCHLHYILRHPFQGRKSFSFVHVTSSDMLHWTWQTTKLQPAFTGHGMFSGTGFITKEGRPAAIYHGQGSRRNQIAIAKDRKISAWEKPYPVEVHTPDGKEADMRHWDPDCFLIGDTYYGISGGPNPPVFKSGDLKNWTYIGDFLKHEMPDVSLGEDISCPNFFPLGDKWMLLCISHPLGCRYYLGDWDAEAEHFVPEQHARMSWRREDQSITDPEYRDFFAPESVLTPDGRRVMWAWLTSLNNELRQKSIQSLPRELSMGEDGTLRIRPLKELETLRYDPVTINDFTVAPPPRMNGGTAFKEIARLEGDACEIRITVDRGQAEHKRFGFRLFAGEGQEGLPILIRPETGTLRVGETDAPFSVADLPEGVDVELRIFVDKYLVEVFANGRQAMVAACMDYGKASGLEAYTFGAPLTLDQVEIWKMKATNQGYLEARQNRIWLPETEAKTGDNNPAKASPAKPAKPAKTAKTGERAETGSAEPHSDHPNFVVIFVDDLGYADIQPFGDRYKTPGLERIAREGRIYNNFYVASSVCTPSRAALMTGCYPARVDMLCNDMEFDTRNHGVLWPGDPKGLNPKETTIAEMLKERGYATACIGKWHLGDQSPFLPTSQGFDEYFGIPFSNDMGSWSTPYHLPLPLARNETVVQNLKPADQDLLTRRYTDYALSFIERNAGHPFFLYIPHSMVHGPHHASPAFRGKTGKGLYADVVAEVDWSVGQITDKLKEMGIEKNTLLIFTSDNGGPYNMRRIPGYSSNYPFSGGKGTAAEGGFRVPTIAWWPGTIPAGTSCDLMASTVDLLPTFAALSGKSYEATGDRPIDGHDLSGLFRGELPETSPRNSFVYYTDNTEPGAPRHPRRLSSVREGKWKYYATPQRFRLAGMESDTEVPAGALFDLENDVAESRNVAPEYPRIARRMKAFAEKTAAELGDGESTGSGVRKAGFVQDALPMNAGARPDVLFIAIDDMNDWTTLFDPENPIKTPHLQRLASMGCLFTHAYCAAPGCNPSRTAIMTGIRPSTSGVYFNRNPWREALPDAVTLAKYFGNNGYDTRGAGKIFHHGPTGAEDPDNLSFTEFLPLQPDPAPEIREGAFGCFDWGAVTEKLADDFTVEWVEEKMEESRRQPQFMAAGIFHPHLPHFAPPEFFTWYPFDRVIQPPMPENDLADVPPTGIQMAHCEHELWSAYLFNDPPPDEDPASLKKLVQSYQASSSYADAMVGRLLDKLESTDRADNTIIVLWSDHGYHLGDKESVVKFTLWEKANHVPFIIVAPGVTKPGSRCDRPVSLVDIYPTLLELAGLPQKQGLDGQSLVPLLRDPDREWDRPAIMTQGPGNHAIRTRNWRYIRYNDGTEELYDQRTDPWNHNNLAADPAFASVIAEHKKWLPETDAPEGPVYRRPGK
jgi:arylsulfatase A-like enzyme/sucrose-6-phosphate hydrolase SacC (GH32 family)